MQRLEEEYGVTLFVRKPTLQLTEEGQQMVFYGRQMLASEQNLRRALSDISENCRSTLRVGMSRLRGTTMFPPIYEQYHKTHPNIAVELVSGNTADLDELLMANKLDLYLGIDVPPNAFEVQTPVGRERLLCVLSRSLLESHYPDNWQSVLEIFRHSVCLADLVDLPLIVLRSGTRVRTLVHQELASQKRPWLAVECDQSSVAYRLAVEGVGAAILSPATRHLHRTLAQLPDGVYAFPLADASLVSHFYLVSRSDQTQPKHLRDFLEEAAVVLKQRHAEILTEDSLPD